MQQFRLVPKTAFPAVQLAARSVSQDISSIKTSSAKKHVELPALLAQLMIQLHALHVFKDICLREEFVSLILVATRMQIALFVPQDFLFKSAVIQQGSVRRVQLVIQVQIVLLVFLLMLLSAQVAPMETT